MTAASMTMTTKPKSMKATLAISSILALTGASLGANGWAQFASPGGSDKADDPALPDASAQAEAEARGSAAQQTLESNIRQRRGFKEVRRQAALDRWRAASKQEVLPKQEAPPRQEGAPKQQTAVQQQAAQYLVVLPKTSVQHTALVPAVAIATNPGNAATTAIADIDVSFKLVPGVAKPGHEDGAWVAPPIQSPYKEGAFTVEARVQGRDAKGRPVDVSPEWTAGASSVRVEPSQGSLVKITVRAVGESNVTMTAMGFSKDLWVSAINQGNAIKVRISD